MPRPITILLVDDDSDCRNLTREAIAHAFPSARVWEVPGGCDALDFLRRRGKYTTAPVTDIVYTDLQMPGMCGQELLKAIRTDPDLENMPVVFLTGLNDEDQQRQAQRNGVQWYALKSADQNELRSTIARTIRHVLGVGPTTVSDAAIQPE